MNEEKISNGLLRFQDTLNSYPYMRNKRCEFPISSLADSILDLTLTLSTRLVEADKRIRLSENERIEVLQTTIMSHTLY